MQPLQNLIVWLVVLLLWSIIGRTVFKRYVQSDLLLHPVVEVPFVMLCGLSVWAQVALAVIRVR